MKNKQQNKTLQPDEVAILLGRFNLARVELGSVNAAVEEIILHPDWRTFTDTFDADVSIIVLKENIKYSNLIQPVCLPDENVIEKYDSGVLVSAKSYK